SIRGTACLKLGDLLSEHARLAQQRRDDPNATWDPAIGAEMRAHRMKHEPAEFGFEAERAYKRVLAEFADVKAYPDQTAGEVAKGRLFFQSALQPGKPLPPLEGNDLDTRPVSAADHRGKVMAI